MDKMLDPGMVVSYLCDPSEFSTGVKKNNIKQNY